MLVNPPDTGTVLTGSGMKSCTSEMLPFTLRTLNKELHMCTINILTQ